jgi:DNA modification methylase
MAARKSRRTQAFLPYDACHAWTLRGVRLGIRHPAANRRQHAQPSPDIMTLSFAPEAIETWPLDRLRPYARNAKTHGADQVAKIAASMAEFGWTVPVLVSSDGEVIAGHGRIMAAAQLGLTEAPVIVLDHLTEAQRRAYRIADNKLTELGAWDDALLSGELQELVADEFDLSLIGFSDGELDRLLALEPGTETSDATGVAPVVIPEPPRNPASRLGDLWTLGDHRLLCGDSTSRIDVCRLMNGERAILFATDPPYLVDYDGSNHPTRNKDWSPSYGVTWDDSSQGAELYDGFIAAAVAEAITEDAAWYCWHASRRQAMLEACWEKAGAFVHQQIIWVKDRGVLTRSHYLWKHEPCFMGWIKGKRPPKVAEETLPSTWALPSFAKDDRPDHPTPKPLDAFGIPMRQHVARGGLCYEPFSGSGSQIMAGEANGRRVFAMEISPAYVDVAIERWQADTGREAILDGDGRTFAQVRTERLGDGAGSPPDTSEADADPEPARKRKSAA